MVAALDWQKTRSCLEAFAQAVGGNMCITLPNRFEVLQCIATPVSPEFSGLGISL